MRIISVALSLLLVAGFCGCASYMDLGWPSRAAVQGSEFAPNVAVQPGQRVRVSTIGRGTISGSLVELDSQEVTIAPADSSLGAITIVAADVTKFEVYTPASWRPIRTAAFVVAGSLAAYKVIDDLTNRQQATPAWEPLKGH